ncbi:desmoplakin isoform X2 [Electrophorus electricus]|uniref:desmoplakin isoform X2 n=1 Tax=Electrophorus electricus TaxID=8005 RepID=UPI0015D05F4E|nr:desmoplakin isoform X2 [Electrophorus electricus]
MSLQGSQLKYSTVSRRTGSKQDLASGGYTLSRSEGGQFLMSGNGYQSDFNDGFIQQGYTTFSKTSAGGYGHQTSSPSSASQSKAQILYNRCMHKLETAQRIMETGGSQAEFDNAMAMAMDDMKQLRMCAMELKTYGQPYEAVSKSLEECSMLQSSLMSRGGMTLGGGAMTLGGGGMTLGGGGMTLGGGGMTLGGGGMTLGGGGIRRKFSTGRDDLGRSFNDAIAWIHQKKRLIETAPFGDKADAIEEQITSHNRFHSSIQKGLEVEKARDELMQKGEKSLLHILDQEWDSLQKMSHARSSQLRELHNIIMEISEAIMWVNIREEEELVFDWGDKQIDTYIPKKQESYSRLMKELESKEKDLNKVKGKVDQLLKNQHPASDKIEAYMDTLQTQWSWLLQITKCINVHLKENAAYSQFFKEANEIYCKLENANSVIRNKFKCDKNTSLEQLNVLLKELEKEKERVAENKRLVHTLVNKSKSIIRLKPRNPEEKSNSPVIVKALCDFKQDQKGIFKDDEGILKDNSQRSKWNVTGPGGLDMLVPSVCLIIPPPNPLSISLAQKNEAFYDSIISIWDHLYITLKSLISWQYCVRDIDYIKSLTFNMLSKMKPEEYRRIITNLELHFQDFLKFSKDSKMFGPEDTFSLESEYKNAQAHYVTLLTTAKQPANVWTEQTKPVLAPPTPAQASLSTSTLNLKLLTQINTLRRRLEAAEAGLGQHLHVPYNENCVQDCTQRLHLIQGVHHDLESIRDEYLHLRDTVMRQLEGTMDKEQASFLRSELDLINQRLGSLQTFSTAYLQRLTALRGVLEGLLCTNDIVKVHEVKLTEKDTSFLDLAKLQDYCISLRQMKADLEQKKELLTSMEVALTQAMYWNGQIDQSFHQCDGDLSKYKELVGQMSDRWRRILTQIDSRLWDLEKQEKQVKHYQQSSSQLSQWMDNTSQRLDGMQASKFSSMNALLEHLNQQKALHSEIKGKKEKVDDVQNDANMCATSIKDYEMQLASYGAGLETLLNIPIKRTVLQSPATVLSQEAGDLQSRYIELLTRSSDYYKFLAEMRKSMEELKIQNTKIELLEEELRHLKEELQNSSQRNKSLEDIIADFKLRLSKTKEEEYMIRRETNAALQSQQSIQITLESTQSKVKELTDRVAELMLLIEDEKRKRRLAEERYNSQQEEYETVIRKRQKELDQVNWSKIDIEKAVKDKEREIERLKTQLEDEATRRRTAESEVSKISMTVRSSETRTIELQNERDSLLAKLRLMEADKGKLQRYEDELSRLKITLESELRQKQQFQDELAKIRKDLNHWKSQYEIRETDKNKAEKDKASSLIEIQRLTTELRSVEDRYKTRLQKLELEVSDLMRRKESVEKELWKLKQRPNTFPKQTQTDENMSTVDPSKLLFDGIRRKVTAHQLLECGIIEKVTLDKLLRGQKTVEEVAVSIQPSLKGTGVIAGVVQGSQKRLSIAEAKHQKLLSPECAIMLLEAQAATGHIIDPKFNEKMSLDTACSRNVVGTEDRDTLIRAEAACTGFKDPYTGKLMSAGQACKKGHLDRETTLRLLQAQEAAGGIIDPVLSVFLPKNVALDRSLIDDELYRALNKNPTCYVEPETGKVVSYSELRKKSIMEPTMGLLLLPVKDETSIKPCCDYNCVAGIYDEAHQRVLPFYKAKQDGLLRPGTTLELLEAQAATGFMIDPINNVGMNVEEAWKRGLIGKEFKEKLHSAEKAVTGYKDPRTGEIISLFQAIERGIIERGHGIRLLEAQIASGGIIDPKTGRRINVDEAYAKGYFDRTMNQILKYEGDDTKGFFDPNNEENLTYLQLTKRCIRDPKTGLLLLPLMDKKKQADLSSQKNTLRKRRVVIVDPETGKEMSVREAYHRELIDYDTFLELSEQECEWEEITITNSDGSSRLVIVDRKTGKQYDIQDSLNKGIISRSTLDQYRAGTLTLTQLANLISSKTSTSELAISTSIPDNLATCSSPTEVAPSSPTVRKRFASVSITLSPPSDVLDDQSPIAAIFDSETLEKITVSEALRRGIVDTITAQRLLEAQVCTGGVINPATGQRLFLQDAVHQGIIDDDMASKLKPAQKAYTGFEDVKTQGKMSAAEAMKEKWLPYEAGQRFLEFQYLTGGLMEPGSGTRVSIEEAIRRGWLDGKGAQKLQDTKSYMKILTCPKTKLKVSYKEALDNCMVEETKAIKMLQASSMSTKGISSPYNISPGPGSRTGSRSGSRSGSRRGSVDYTSFSFSRISPSF